MKALKISFIMLLSLMILIGCSLGSRVSDDDDDDDTTTGTSSKIQSSIISLPESLTGSSSSSSATARSRGDGEDASMLYEHVREYISIADDLKEMVKDFMQDVSGVIDVIPKDSVYTIPGATGNEPRRIKLSRTIGAEYNWQLSLYFDLTADDPGLIARFTLGLSGSRGNILWYVESEDASLDVTFDGTGTSKTLEIKIDQDVSDPSNDAADPEKVYITASKTGDEYSICGLSYHPNLKGTNDILGDNRCVYLFKAKAKDLTSSTDGAKLYLAIPEDTLSNISTVWDDDSIGKVYTDYMLDRVNTEIAELADETNDVDHVGDVIAEKLEALAVMGWVLNVPLLFDATNDFTEAEYNAAKTYWTANADLDVSGDITTALSNTIDTYTKFSAYLSTLTPPYSEEIYWVMGPAKIEEHGYQLTQAELEAFINTTSDDPDEINFKNTYNSIKYLINPAFYDSTNGFLGTYDESNDVFYEYTGTLLQEAASKPSNFTELNALNPDCTGYVPTVVIADEIVIQ